MARHSDRGAGAAVAVALLIGYPCFRFRIIGHYFALVTLALSAIVLQVVTATRDLTGGSLGYTPERYQGGSSIYALQFTDKQTWYLIALGVWAVGLLIRYCGRAQHAAATRSRRSPRTKTPRRRPAFT